MDACSQRSGESGHIGALRSGEEPVEDSCRGDGGVFQSREDRPAGVVNDDILANTNMRVALRVQSREDSSNVIDVPDAAAIGRQQKGRALVKLGQDDITPVQTALVTGPIESEEREAIAFTDLTTGGSSAPSRPARCGPSPWASA